MNINKQVVFVIVVTVVIGIGYAYKASRADVVPVARTVGVADISRRANDVPPPITRTAPDRVVVNIEATQVVAELAPGTTYEYWTYNNTVPGPFIRVREGDTVEVHLSHVHAHGDSHAADDFPHSFSIEGMLGGIAEAHGGVDDGHSDMMTEHMDGMMADEADHSSDGHDDGHTMSAEEAAHMAEGHAEHSVDLHAVMGPGGGAMMSKTKPNETTVFEFKAQRSGIYVYHCASPHIPTHIANGMYGLILVEPKEGLAKVDKEFYVMQSDMYTKSPFGVKGHQILDTEKLKYERPEYFVFNGRVGGLAGDRALRVKAGETVRIFFGVGTHIAAYPHIIGGIIDKLYPEGDIVSPPHRNVQTTVVPPGGAAMMETTFEVPGKYLLVDHSLTRAIDKGALGEIIVEGPERPDVLKKIK